MRFTWAVLLITGTAVAQPKAQPKPEPDNVTWDEARFDASGKLLHLRTHDPQLVKPGAFDEDSTFDWGGVIGVNRDTTGLEVVNSQHVVTARAMGFMLGNTMTAPRPAGIAVVTKVGKGVDIDIGYARLAPEAVRKRVVGGAYAVVAHYGRPVQLDDREAHKIERTTRRTVHLADEQVYAGDIIISLHGKPRFAICVEGDHAPEDEIEGLEVYDSHLEPLGKSPALPLLVDAVTGETLPLHPARCVFDPIVP